MFKSLQEKIDFESANVGDENKVLREAGDGAAAGLGAGLASLFPNQENEVMIKVKECLPVTDVVGIVASYLHEDVTVRRLIRCASSFFPNITSVHELLYAVVMGEPEKLVEALDSQMPISTLFEKSTIKDACEQIFYQVSPFQMISVLCDGDMFTQIFDFILGSEYWQIANKQFAELKGGGPDLITMNVIPEMEFDKVLQYQAGVHYPSMYPLLENKDGIIFCRITEQFFYVNQETQTLTLIIPEVSEEDFAEFSAFKTSLVEMGKYGSCSRRSNNKEHALIKRTMKHPETTIGICLERRGIHYERDGVHYIDTRIEVRLPKVSLQYARLSYLNASADDLDAAFQSVGRVQREIVHLLQRFFDQEDFFCIKSTPRGNGSPFSNMSYVAISSDDVQKMNFNRVTKPLQLLYSSKEANHFQPFKKNKGLGFDFALVKGKREWSVIAPNHASWNFPIDLYKAVELDAAAVQQIMNAGKATIAAYMEVIKPAPSEEVGDDTGRTPLSSSLHSAG